MAIIGADDLGKLDEQLRLLFQTLILSKKATPADSAATRRFLEWVIYPEWENAGEVDVRPIQWSDGLSSSERNLLKQVARSGAMLVKSGKDRDKAELVQACQELLKGRGVEFGTEQAAATAKVDRATDARDKFVYQKICKGVAARQILSLIDQHPDWHGFSTAAEALDCAVRYAQRHGLPLPPTSS